MTRGRAGPLAAAVAVNAAAGTLFSWSVLLPELASDFPTSERVLVTPFSTAVAVFAISVVAAGRAVDRFGARRTSAVAGALSGVGLSVTALAQHLVTLHVGFGLLFGAGSGLAYSSVVTWASTHDDPGAKRSVGVVVAAYAAGPVIAGPVGGLSSTQWGWRTTLLLGASVVATVTVLASRMLPDAAVGARANAEPTVHRTEPSALTALWLLFLCGTVPGLFAFAYAADLAAERGLDPRLGGLAVASMGMGNLVGRLLTDPLIGRVGLRTALRTDLVLMSVGLVALASLSGEAAALFALVLLAVQYGALSALLPTAVRRVCDPSRFGRVYGLVFSSWGLAGVLAPRLHDPAAAQGTGLRSWVLLTVAAIVSLAAYDRLLAQHRP